MNILFYDFFAHKSINWSHILPNSKNVNMVTPTLFLSFRKDTPNILQNTLILEKLQYFNIKNSTFSLKFHDCLLKSNQYCQNDMYLQKKLA